MAFEEDISVFFEDVAVSFATEFSYTPAAGDTQQVRGIFDAAYIGVDGGGVPVAANQPQIVYATSNIQPAPQYGDSVQINNKDYMIVNVQPDGTGITTLLLDEKDA